MDFLVGIVIGSFGTLVLVIAVSLLIMGARRDRAMKFCTWMEDSDGIWQTSCGESFFFDTGTPEENKMHYCPFCGEQLTQEVFKEGE